jgi:hypothetical protein
MSSRPNAARYLTNNTQKEHIVWKAMPIVVVFGAFLFFIFGPQNTSKKSQNLKCYAVGTQPNVAYKINLRRGCDVSICDKPISVATVVSHGTLIDIDKEKSVISQNGVDWIPVLFNNERLYIAKSRISCYKT